MARRQCQGKTQRGTQCRAAPLQDGDYCLAHANEEQRQSVGFGGSQPGAGRPRQPRVVERMLARVEADIEQVLKPYFDALNAKTSDGTSDHDLRMRAADKLLDRVYGKPRQQLEHSGPDGGPFNTELKLDGAGREALANVLRQRPYR